MAASPPPPPVAVRIGTSERDAAITALGEHMRAGRLDPDEYGDRVARASTARYEAELAPLFTDLPMLSGGAGTTTSSQHGGFGRPGTPPSHRLGAAAFAAAPFVALITFFVLVAVGVSDAWLVFLLIPMTATLATGGRRRRPGNRARRRSVSPIGSGPRQASSAE